ncbi:MAG: cysteine desulfurase NifS, partial [Clostridia bacterium]|nr:cysteine desulfurase NifS [Clostridia bacterium]
AGICASAGSACNAKDTAPSHVLTAIGRDAAAGTSSLRLTLGRENTMEDVEAILSAVGEITKTLREMQPG